MSARWRHLRDGWSGRGVGPAPRRAGRRALGAGNREITAGRNHFGRQILVHPKDRRTLVIVESEQTTNKSNCPVHVSRDGGRTWATRQAQPKPEEFGACTRGSFGPSLDARSGADGTLYVLAAGAILVLRVGPRQHGAGA